MTKTEDNRVKQIAIGVGILLVLMLAICGALLGWGYLPGILGEWVGLMIGVATTPFLMEATFVVLGLVIVVLINHWRRKRDGDELVFLEQLEGDDLPATCPSMRNGRSIAKNRWPEKRRRFSNKRKARWPSAMWNRPLNSSGK